MGTIVASCHHEVSSSDDLVSVMYKEQHHDSDGISHVVVYAEFCKQCADDLKQTSDWLATDEDAENYLNDDFMKVSD